MQGLAGLGYEIVDQPMLDTQHGLPQMRETAEMLADFGRYGDTYIVHAAEGETVVPMEVLDSNPRLKNMLFAQMQEMGIEPERYIVGNELNSINPTTGQPEFFLKKLFKGIKKAVKKVGGVLKKIAPIVLPIVAPFLLPAMPIAFASGLGSLAGGLVSGQNFKDSLKGALITGGLAGLGNMAFRGGEFFGSKAAASGQLGDVGFREAFSLDNPFTAATPDAVTTAQQAVADRAAQAASAVAYPAGTAESITRAPLPPVESPQFTFQDLAQQQTGLSQGQFSPVGAVERGSVSSLTAPRPTLGQALKQVATPGDQYGIGDFYSDYLSPSRASIQPDVAAASAQGAQDAASTIASRNAALAAQGLPELSTAAQQTITQNAIDAAIKSSAPNILAKYGPLAATAVGAGMASDALLGTNIFKEPDIEPPGLVSRETGFDYLEREPERYGFDPAKFFGRNPYYQGLIEPQQSAQRVYDFATSPTYTAANFVNPYLAPASQAVMGLPAITRAAEGGEIVGPGTGKSDSIPALLSDGEFVLTEQAVRGAGGGDRRRGAKNLYSFMRNLEGMA